MREAARALVVSRLRDELRRVQAAPRRSTVALSSGLPEIDEAALFRLGSVVELCGEEASGRTSLALRLVAAACREKRLSAWVDGPAELYPPGAVQLGVELRRLLIVRPQAPGQLVWSTVQLLRSGAFTLVVLDVTHTGVRLTMVEAKKLLEAARTSGAALVVLTSVAAPAVGVARVLLQGLAVSPLRAVRRPLGSPSGVGRRLGVGAGEGAGGGAAFGDGGEVEGGSAEVSALRLELVHGGASRTVSVPRHRLCLHSRSRRTTGVHAAGLVVLQPDAAPSLQRPRKNFEREGYGACFGRPGRDVPLRLGNASAPAVDPAARWLRLQRWG